MSDNGTRRMRIAWTTNGSGAATATGDRTISGGKLEALIWNKGTGDAGIDFTIATTGADGSGTILTVANANSSIIYYPRTPVVDTSGAAIAGVYDTILIDGIPTVTIAQGGATKTGSVILLYKE